MVEKSLFVHKLGFSTEEMTHLSQTLAKSDSQEYEIIDIVSNVLFSENTERLSTSLFYNCSQVRKF